MYTVPARAKPAPVAKFPCWSSRKSGSCANAFGGNPKRENCCGQKLAYFLENEHGITLSVPKIYKIRAEKYTLDR